MSRIVLTKGQRTAIEQAKKEGKHRITMELTEKQKKVMREIDAEVEAERESVIKRGRQIAADRKHRIAYVADQIRDARAASGFSLADVAEKTGMTRSAISKIESGQNRNPTISTISRIAFALGKEWEITLRDTR